jgi:hypothetical protein
VRVKLGSASYLTAAGAGYGIGLDEDGHRIEFVGDWRALDALGAELQHDSVYVDVEGWQIVAVDDEIRIDLGRQAMHERAAFLRSALAQQKDEEP